MFVGFVRSESVVDPSLSVIFVDCSDHTALGELSPISELWDLFVLPEYTACCLEGVALTPCHDWVPTTLLRGAH